MKFFHNWFYILWHSCQFILFNIILSPETGTILVIKVRQFSKKRLPQAVVQRCSVKKVLLETSQNSAKLCLRPQACNFIKKDTLAQVFSREFCEISKNTFFQRTPLVAVSGLVLLFVSTIMYRKPRWIALY